ncbi:MAG TPA: sulfatase-like hydrolase/transferase [Candidatus Binatia bacterium]|nr:sulfatase-like hydrolase/transferase [Candidatus Binatia bacterium]
MYNIKLLTIRLGLLLILYSVCRLLFLAFNYGVFQSLIGREIFTTFAIGLRFDISAICLTNSIFITCSVLPHPWQHIRRYQRFLKLLFLATNIPFLILNVIDLEYSRFVGQRLTLSVLDLRGDLSDQIGQLALHYWYLGAIAGLLISLLWYLYPQPPPVSKAATTKARSWIWIRELLVMAVVLSLAVIGGRGGWQQKSLTLAHADVFGAFSLGHLALNSSFTLIKSQEGCGPRSLPKVRFFASDAELKQELNLSGPPAYPREHRRDNIVIIIIESLGAEDVGRGNPNYGFTPFLDTVASKGIFFRNNFANAHRSIDALPSILAGLPSLSDSSFRCSMNKELHGVGSLLKEHGYDTSFFHGGRNGTMYFDVFSKRMGFDRYFGLNEYPDPADSDGIWGIYDEPFLQFAARELSRRKAPFVSVIFTLTSHNPYKLPAQYQGVFPKGDSRIHESIGYTDHALKKFFETAEKMPWYENTLFIVTGDHTEVTRKTFSNTLDAYRVPLIFFHPARKLPEVNPAKITQHADIAPSVMDYLGIKTNRLLPFGRSVFNPSPDGLALNQVNGRYWLAHKNYYVEYRIDGPSWLYDLGRDPLLESPVTDQIEVKSALERRLQAYIQWFNNGLAENRLYR